MANPVAIAVIEIAIAGCCPWAIAKDVTTPAPSAAGIATSNKERSDLFLYIIFEDLSGCNNYEFLKNIFQQSITRVDRLCPDREILQLILTIQYNSSSLVKITDAKFSILEL
jgi:hypothetical protein